MANKLPWFTHDHNARNDDFIRRAEDRFGHFGYAGYFKILELLHEHGNGDILNITQARLAQELRSRWPQVRLLLDFCRTSGKVQFNLKPGEVEVQIKKFRERQSKLKSNLPSTFRQPSVNLPQEGEGEREGHKGSGFESFWSGYPNKKARAAAARAWEKLAPDVALSAAILAAVDKQKESPSWVKDGGQFIPHAATWLNGKRWEDETIEAGSREIFA